MKVEIVGVQELRFDDGTPVRAASALARLDDGWLVAQDDATHAAWVRPSGTTRVRLLPSVEGHDLFAEADGTKHLKPDLEAACEVEYDGEPAVLLLGSGSTPARTRGVLVMQGTAGSQALVADLVALQERVGAALGAAPGELNLEGATVLGGALRWFQRGLPGAGRGSASIDVELTGLLQSWTDPIPDADLGVVLHYDLAGLAVTDAVHLEDGRVLASAVAEDAPDSYVDGPVTASELVLLDGAEVLASAAIPTHAGRVVKVEGLALAGRYVDGVRVLATADLDDPEAASPLLELRVSW